MTGNQSQPLFIAVTGMHRSGTSLVAGLLERAGVFLGPGDHFIPSNEENPMGFFERRDVRALNDQLLREMGCDWAELDRFDLERLSDARRSAFERGARPLLAALQKAAPHGVFAIKEPRLCLLLPAWLRCLEVPVLQLVVHRSAEEVARSLEQRNGMPAKVAHHLHQAYLSRSLRMAREHDHHLLSYRACREAPVETLRALRERLQAHGLTLPAMDEPALADFVKPELYRSRVDGDAGSEVPTTLGKTLASLVGGSLPDRLPAWPRPSAEVLAWQHQHRFERWRTAHERGERLRERLDRVEDALNDQQDALLALEKATGLDRGELADAIDRLRSERRSLASALESARQDMEEIDERLARAQLELGEQRAAVEKAGETLAAQKKSQQSELERLTRQHGRERARLEAEGERLEAERQRLEENVTLLEESLTRSEAGRTALEQALSDAGAARADLEDRLAHEKKQRRGTEAQLQGLQDVLKEQRRNNIALKKERAELVQLREQTAQVIHRDRQRIRELQDRQADLERDKKDLLASLSWRLTAPLRALGALAPERWFTPRRRESPGPVVQSPGAEPPARLPGTALVITWDIGHNPLGRSYMLAEVLDRVFHNVVIVGFRFDRFGKDTWKPLRNSAIPVIGLKAGDFPGFLEELERLATRISPSVVFACKPRLPSLELGALIRQATGCPLVLDIDDHELTFFGNAPPISLDRLDSYETASAEGEVQPFDRFWTCVAEEARCFADAILVSNPALEEKFGGLLLPHVRDEERFDPQRVDANAQRERLGIPPDARVVLFFGTPRKHKGIDRVARAVGRLEDERALLVVIGEAPDRRDLAGLEELTRGRLSLLGNQPFQSIPEVLSIADLVCLPQDPDHPISRYQLPAKAVDAIAMGIPLVVSDTPPLRWLADLGLARIATEDDLDTVLAEVLAQGQAAVGAGDGDEDARQAFLRHLSYATAAERLRGLSSKLLTTDPETRRRDPEFTRFLASQRRVLGMTEVPPEPAATEGIDIVLFWKQNDSRIYGRRVDMIVRLLAEREDVRRVLVFDSPISEFDLTKLRQAGEVPSQNRRIYEETYGKVLGQADEGKVSYHVFAHPPGIYDLPHRQTPGRRPLEEGFLPFVEETLLQQGVEPGDAVFWFYPRFYLAEPLLDALKPLRVVVDVVDDHREWPGTSERNIELLDRHYRELLSRADLTLVNCEPMARKMQPLAAGRFECVPNGCDANPPVKAPSRDHRAFQSLLRTGRPVIGYVGNLEAKVDVDLIERVATDFPDCLVLLVGSAHASNQALGLRRLDNVLMPGIVPYEEIGAWLQRFDVAMVPHRQIRMTESMNPLKVFVYLQWGVPVVSTQVSNIGYEGPMLTLAKDGDGFVAAVRAYLDDPRRDWSGEVAEFVAANSWEARFTPLLDDFFRDLAPAECWNDRTGTADASPVS